MLYLRSRTIRHGDRIINGRISGHRICCYILGIGGGMALHGLQIDTRKRYEALSVQRGKTCGRQHQKIMIKLPSKAS